MGPELALALAAGGTAAQMIGQRQQQKERQRILNRAMDRTEQTQRDATRQVLDEAANFDPQTRLKAMQEQEAATAAQAAQDIGGGAAAGIPEAAGDVSNDYKQALGASRQREQSRLAQVIGEAARVRAPGQMQTEEALRRAVLAGELGSKWSTTKNLARAAELDAESVDMPLYGELGKLAQVAGMVGGSLPGAATTSAATNPALIESAAGTAGYGVSSASSPWWAKAAPRIRFGG